MISGNPDTEMSRSVPPIKSRIRRPDASYGFADLGLARYLPSGERLHTLPGSIIGLPLRGQKLPSFSSRWVEGKKSLLSMIDLAVDAQTRREMRTLIVSDPRLFRANCEEPPESGIRMSRELSDGLPDEGETRYSALNPSGVS